MKQPKTFRRTMKSMSRDKGVFCSVRQFCLRHNGNWQETFQKIWNKTCLNLCHLNKFHFEPYNNIIRVGKGKRLNPKSKRKKHHDNLTNRD